MGLGKLGLPCALVLAQHHQVQGYDVSDKPWDILGRRAEPMQEQGIGALLADEGHRIGRAASVIDLVRQCEVIFVAVQTPHAPGYGGDRPMPEDPWDFDYSYLAQACRDITAAAEAQQKHVVVVIVSTVLPGTTDRLLRPELDSDFVEMAYSPQFIAMGTTIADFANPEFVICGTDRSDSGVRAALRSVFQPVHGDDRLFHCDITTAEAIKVFYNTFVSLKIVWANHVMELCAGVGADCDLVVDALERATDRVISPKYLRGGMGDGGACHPRDLIAMSWLEDRLGSSTTLFRSLAVARELQTQWLADLVRHYAALTGYEVQILGISYKPGSNLVDGSPALLLASYLADIPFAQYDPHAEPHGAQLSLSFESPQVYVIATRHEEFRDWGFVPGSVVIDPFGYIADREQLTVVRPGRRGISRS